MSIPRNFWAKLWGVSARACAKYFTRFLGMYWESKFHFWCCYDQKQQPQFFHSCCFFVGFCCRNKKLLPKCCPAIKKNFCLENFSWKAFLMFLVNLVTGELILWWPMYLHHIWYSCRWWERKKYNPIIN